MEVICLAHPVAGDVPANVARAKRWLAWACRDERIAPVMPWLPYVELFAGDDDADLVARKLSIARSGAAASCCDELWLVGGLVSSGMRDEALAVHSVRPPLELAMVWERKPIIDLTYLGDEPPDYPPKYLPKRPRWSP